ncbi:MAG: hypothetical protein QME93_05495 [Bacillota bacterium]|nr:hypothetical protein [Bacillota bacterium]MDI7249508.1 hypothetical protein [Bacillota bacterium]
MVRLPQLVHHTRLLAPVQQEATETEEIIARRKARGMTRWVEKNEQKLRALSAIMKH